MAKKVLIIFNPLAGKGQIKAKLWQIVDLFIKDGYNVGVHCTQKVGDTESIVQKYGRRYNLIVITGGDGTLNEAVRGIMKLDVKPYIGYIPCGTTNDFAASLRLSKDIIKATKSIINGTPFLCDIGKFNDRFYTYVSAFGAFTEVSYLTPQQSKNAFGHMAYIFEGMKSLQNIKPYYLKVSFENETIEDEFVFGMVSNSKYIGGIENIVKNDVCLNDGIFEVTLIKNPKNPLDLQNIIAAYFKKQPDNNYVYSYKTNSVTIESKEEIPWTLDGEYGGSHKKAEISIIPEAITFLK